MSKLTCPSCGQRCLQIIAKMTVLIDQDEDGLLIDPEITNEMFGSTNQMTLDAINVKDGTIRVSRSEKIKYDKDSSPVVVCHSDECGGVEYKYSDVIKGEEIRVSNKSW